MKFKKIAALCSCLSMVGSLMCPMTVGADGMEPETALYEEVQTEESASGAESENATECSQAFGSICYPGALIYPGRKKSGRKQDRKIC